MLAWVHTYMATRTSPDPEPSRLRRRVVFELSQQELPLLDAAEARHGTKRAGIVAALAAAAGAAEREARLAEVERRLAAATAAARDRTGEEKRRDASGRELAEARQALAEAERQREAGLEALSQLKHRLARQTARAESENDVLGEEIERLQDERVSALYCARCESWAPEGEWAWQPIAGGERAHHTPCGDHGPGLLATASWLARRGILGKLTR